MATKIWTSPTMEAYNFYLKLLEQKHLLIAGATGSGKSVIVNGMIHTALRNFPVNAAGGAKFILIDPKRVELVDYKELPHTIYYASEPRDMVNALQVAIDVIDRRFAEMQQRHEKLYSGGDVYVFIDEWADLVTLQKKKVEPLVQRIAQIGRASKVRLVLCTQAILREIINTNIRVNFTSICGLHVPRAQDSRNVLGRTGLELLPPYGSCILQVPGEELTLYNNIPKIPDEEIQGLIKHWVDQK